MRVCAMEYETDLVGARAQAYGMESKEFNLVRACAQVRVMGFKGCSRVGVHIMGCQ